MKTQAQIIKYISQNRFPDEDWADVLAYCREHFGNGKARKASAPISMSTYRQFLDWVDNGIGVGEVVKYENILGIVCAFTPDITSLSPYLSAGGALITNDVQVPSSKIIKGDGVDITKLDEALADKELGYDKLKLKLIKVYTPDDGDFVRVTTNRGKFSAIYKSDDDIYHYFYLVIKGKVMYENKRYKKSNALLSPTTRANNLAILHTLSKNNLKWSAKDKKLNETSERRVPKGSRYYYVTDKFDVVGCIDRYTKTHKRRFDKGNYFGSFAEAYYFRERILEQRKMIAEEKYKPVSDNQ